MSANKTQMFDEQREIKILKRRQEILREALMKALPHMDHTAYLEEDWNDAEKIR